MMDDMEWARFALSYLADARTSTREQFNALVSELREEAPHSRTMTWFSPTKNIILTLGHFAEEFAADQKVPGEKYGSPAEVAAAVDNYRAFVAEMRDDLEGQGDAFCSASGVTSYPFLLQMTLERARHLLAAADYVISLRGADQPTMPTQLECVSALARRFDESVATLATHPHGRAIWQIQDEWDCQYLFRAILVGYFRDVRIEEPNPSFAGAPSRCEFFLKPLRAMVEIKYVRKSSDQKRITSELALDIVQYGANPEVDHLVALIYDPHRLLRNPVQLQTDLAGPTKSLADVRVIVSPPR